MSKQTAIIAGLVAIALATAGTLAAMAMSADEPGSPEAFSADDDGAAIGLGVGESITVELAGNPTTGYGWQVAGFDAAVVSIPEPQYTAESDLIGSGGTYRFTITAAGAGETEVRLVYLRPWEQEAPLETFTITVTVP